MTAAAAGEDGGIPAPPSLTRFAWLSILAAILTIALKTEAYLLTGSVGLLSDAAESVVNLVAACIALLTLWFAARPADAGHPFGHGKVEYFASGFEGALILLAAGGIAWAAWERVVVPAPLARLDLGMAVSASAGVVNLAVAIVLLRAGRRYGSITLEADGRHLLSDVWTTVAVLLALAGITLTGWTWLDPAIAFLAAAQIVWSGLVLVGRSVSGLLDAAIPDRERALIEGILDRYRAEEIQFHDLRTRASGTQRFMTVHVLVPGGMSVHDGHDLVERIEGELRSALDNLTVVTHLEPMEDLASFAHENLETARSGGKPGGNAAFGGGRAGRARYLAGMALLVAGSVASMVFPDPYAEIGLGVSLFGLVLGLSGSRKIRDSLNRTPPS